MAGLTTSVQAENLPQLEQSAPVTSRSALQKAEPPLLTNDQRRADEIVAALLSDPAVKAARDGALKLWASSPSASIEDGKTRLPDAVDELAAAAARSVAAGDPSNPPVIWIENPSYSWGDLKVHAARVAGDSPDRIYRLAAVDPAYTYEIHGRRRSHDDFNFEADADWKPAAVIKSSEIDIAPDGTFTVIADATPTNGRRNHLQLPVGTNVVLFRDTLIDWAAQSPNELVIKRIDGPAAQQKSAEALGLQAAQSLTKLAELNLTFVGESWKLPANTIKPFVRKLEYGVPGAVLANGRFSIKDDEALVVTLDPGKARYLGFQLLDPWYRSVPYWEATSSLNNQQAKHNPDGTITYVLAPKDPGYYNWIDSGGLNEGLILIRLETFSEQPQLDKIVREAKLVKRSELASALPKDAPLATPEQRAQQIAERKAGFLRRLAVQGS